ncbi:MAG: hypothetical protein KH086_01405, partial [Coprobacillus sp.]|nr:hypothetical protein [Coprobacillus sp.]
MKKSEPKLILNLQLDSEELDQKVKLAMDKYIEDVIVGNLDDEIEKIVTKRIGKEKLKTIYVCTQCGETSPRWLGRCPSCGAWNT